MSIFSKGLQRFSTDFGNIVRDPVGEFKKGPRGTTGVIAGKLYGGTFKDIMDTMQGKNDDDADTPGVSTPVLRASQVDPEGELGALQDIRKKKQGRKAANLSPASGASILTS